MPGYDPDISAELYTTNGETTEHAERHVRHLAFTPEMSTCETASESVPDDEWEAEDCGSVFNFPDDEELVQAEFEKNIPFAIATAQSARDPDDPVSVVGREAPDFVVDSFDVSYGDPQPWPSTARGRPPRHHELPHQRRARHARWRREWRGGERYGDDDRRLLRRVPRQRARAPGPATRVEVWFTGTRTGARLVESEHFTYTLAADSGADGAHHRRRGLHRRQPDLPGRHAGPSTLDDYGAALDANGVSHEPGTWTPRACPTRSACSATSTRSSGSWATTA